MNKTLTAVALVAGLVLAQPPARSAELVMLSPDGQMAALLVPVQPVMAGIFAQQDAMLHHMMAEMAALDQLEAASLARASMPVALPQAGSSVVMTSISNGQQSCSRTVTIRAQANGAAPLVQVSQEGDGCTALPQPPAGATVPAAEPVANPAEPPKLIRVRYDRKPGGPVQYRG